MRRDQIDAAVEAELASLEYSVAELSDQLKAAEQTISLLRSVLENESVEITRGERWVRVRDVLDAINEREV